MPHDASRTAEPPSQDGARQTSGSPSDSGAKGKREAGKKDKGWWWWPRLRCPLGRWVYLILLFIYLFSLAMTLMEIDAFQRMVAQMTVGPTQAGGLSVDSRRRQIVQALRQVVADGGEGARPTHGGDAAVYSRIAAQLDPLRLAVASMGEFGTGPGGVPLRFQQRGGGAYALAKEEELRDLAGQVELAVADLSKQVGELSMCKSKDSACTATRSVRDDLREIERALAELPPLPTPDAQDQAGANSGKPPTTSATKGEKDKLIDALRALQKVAKDNENKALTMSALVDEIRASLVQLQNLDDATLSTLVDETFPAAPAAPAAGAGAESGMTKPDVQLAKVTERLSLAKKSSGAQVELLRRILQAYGIKYKYTDLQGAIPSTASDRQRFDETLDGLVKTFQKAHGLKDDGDVGQGTREKLDAVVDECNKSPAACGLGAAPRGGDGRPVDVQRDLRELSLSLRELTRYVAQQKDVDLRDMTVLTRTLTKMDVAARRLAELDVVVESSTTQPDGAQSQGAAPIEYRARYEQATSELRTALKRLSTALGDNTNTVAIAQAIGEDDPRANSKAETIISEFRALARYQSLLTPFAFLQFEVPKCPAAASESQLCFSRALGLVANRILGIGFRALDMATMSRDGLDMLAVLVMGAIGSLIYLIRYLLSQLLNLRESQQHYRPWSWYIFRPLFGVVVAFAVYLLYRAGQIALGGATPTTISPEANLPILALFSLFAGLLSWQTLAMVQNKGERWIKAQRRENLWATGLRGALRQAGKTTAECATQVGVTPVQVDRWMGGQDKVTPEMQDRVLTWLNREPIEIFSDTNPRDVDQSTLQWATGLRRALESNPAGIDVPQLAHLVNQDVETVRAWVDLKLQVPEPMQYLIADKLKVPVEKLFTPEKPDADYWAFGLRRALKKGGSRISDAATLAKEIGSTQQRVRAYMELQEPVSKPVRMRIVEALGVDGTTLFKPDRPLDSEYRWAAKLRECMRNAGITNASELADKIDTEAIWVRSWMEQEMLEVVAGQGPPYVGQVPPDTQPMLAEALGCDAQTLFRSERSAADFRWVVMPKFGELVKERGGADQLASQLDLDKSRVDLWMRGGEPVAPGTQQALGVYLGISVEDLDTIFTNRPPPDPSKPRSALWATGLRAAVRAHRDLRTLGRLAAELGVAPRDIYDYAELLAPVPADLRERIERAIGPLPAGAKPVFSVEAPDWSEFRFAPGLAQAMAERGLKADDLAERLDVDVPRVLDWIALDERPVEPLWSADKVKRGQLSKPSREALVEALGGGASPDALFAKERPVAGAQWAVKPDFAIMVEGYEGGVERFAADIDADPARVRRWLDQKEPVEAGMQARILRMLGLPREHASQIFFPEPIQRDEVG
jgi:transcriptional regulator with XRE-family HTH domain/peptidoglycan hydrolase-like protein with peptidoglycan-binding domain